jgi:putative two-component system response regulator
LEQALYLVIVDDVRINNVLMEAAVSGLAESTRVFESPLEALSFIQDRAAEIAALIVDFDMPGMTGLELVANARTLTGFEHVPVVMVTSSEQRQLRRDALGAGVTDFLSKPFDVVEVRARVTNLIRLHKCIRDLEDRSGSLERVVAEAVAEIEAREQELVTRLVRATEHRDTDTGEHITRVSRYVGLIARHLGLEAGQCRRLALASTMHDIGKIAIPDTILLKKGPLSPEERREMERHTLEGYAILEGSSCDVVRLAAEIAISHHEHWDGAGYPNHSRGDGIPISGRIVAVADVFDALVSVRPYKRAWTLEAALQHLIEQRGSQFDPACIDAFVSGWSEVIEIAAGRELVAA